MKFIYIASPYTKGDVAINVRQSVLVADELAATGFVPFAPLLFHFWHLISPQPYEFWTRMDMAWIDKCDAALRLPGDSSGADAEIARARDIGLPVYFGMEEFRLAFPTTPEPR